MTRIPGAAEAARSIARGETCAVALIEAIADRIAEREPQIQAYTALDLDAARARAQDLDRGPPRGPLHGVPIAVKDVFDTADLPTSHGSAIWVGHRPRADAAAVALARAAGAVILGKTVTTEFASYTPGATRNPHDVARTPGGSSSGSAAAVAAGMACTAFGTQTAGSIIRPAAYCGVVGYKPSFGMIPRAGMKPLAESFDTAGTLAPAVADAALLASVAAGRADIVPPQAPEAWPVIGLLRTDWWHEAEPAQQAALESLARALSAAGARVVDLPAPGIAWANERHGAAMAWEVARAFAWERAAAPHLFSAKFAEICDRGLRIAPAENAAIRADLGRACIVLRALFERCDVVLTPSAPGEAPRGLAATGAPTFNRIWSLLGGPCLSLPCGWGREGMPLGAQLAALPGQDALLLGTALRVERVVAAAGPFDARTAIPR